MRHASVPVAAIERLPGSAVSEMIAGEAIAGVKYGGRGTQIEREIEMANCSINAPRLVACLLQGLVYVRKRSNSDISAYHTA